MQCYLLMSRHLIIFFLTTFYTFQQTLLQPQLKYLSQFNNTIILCHILGLDVPDFHQALANYDVLHNQILGLLTLSHHEYKLT